MTNKQLRQKVSLLVCKRTGIHLTIAKRFAKLLLQMEFFYWSDSASREANFNSARDRCFKEIFSTPLGISYIEEPFLDSYNQVRFYLHGIVGPKGKFLIDEKIREMIFAYK